MSRMFFIDFRVRSLYVIAQSADRIRRGTQTVSFLSLLNAASPTNKRKGNGNECHVPDCLKPFRLWH